MTATFIVPLRENIFLYGHFRIRSIGTGKLETIHREWVNYLTENEKRDC
jgi:hypothetical protein